MVKSKNKVETEAKEVENSQPLPAKNNSVLVIRIFMWGIFLLLLLGIWLNPEGAYRFAGMFQQEGTSQSEVSSYEENPSIRQLQKQMQEVKAGVIRLGAEMSKAERNNSADERNVKFFEDKLSELEAKNFEALQAKADASVVLGLVERLDRIEQRLEKVAKISDRGALLLTSVMLIKDSAERGNSFEYEAEVLRQLAEGDTVIESAAGEILADARTGISSKDELTAEFEKIYGQILRVEQDRENDGKDWKGILNKKLNEYVRVKRIDKDKEDTQEDSVLEQAKTAVDAGYLDKAAVILGGAGSEPLLADYSELAAWRDGVLRRNRFYDAVTKISTQALAVMKLNYVQNDTETVR